MSSETAWFPNFCRPPVVFGLAVGAELLVLVMFLAPGREFSQPLRELAVNSLFVQWLTMICTVCLCKLRPAFNRLSVRAGLGAAYLLVLLLVAVATVLAVWLQQFSGIPLSRSNLEVTDVVGHNVLITALVAGVALRYYYVQQRWRADLQARADAQVRALQARIRPHFLFNSMNTIASLIRSRPEVAERTVEDLSELFRSALSGRDSDSTLGQELTLCRRYVSIEQLRLGERLQVSWDVDPLPVRELLPPLILQPLFENAVYHGIQPLPEGGEVKVSSGSDADWWWITIDNPVAGPSTARPPGNQIALENIEQRLEHRYDGRARIETQNDGERFTVTVKIPITRQMNRQETPSEP
ncbi:MAG: histidine kinase [Xanthomonadales bacterium]|nr:histidine kinase [Xanthomonadales bacterium]